MSTVSIQFVEEKRNKPHYNNWYGGIIDHIDTYFIMNGEKFFMSGIAECAPNYEKREIKDYKERLLKSEGKYFRFYGGLESIQIRDNKEISNPVDYAKHVKAQKWHFQDPTLRYSKSLKCWDFHGNIKEFSGAFWYRIYDKDIVEQLKTLLPKYATKAA